MLFLLIKKCELQFTEGFPNLIIGIERMIMSNLYVLSIISSMTMIKDSLLFINELEIEILFLSLFKKEKQDTFNASDKRFITLWSFNRRTKLKRNFSRMLEFSWGA